MTSPQRPDGAPAVASRRGYLRGGLPAVYRDHPAGRASWPDDRFDPRGLPEPFAMRFVAGLESVLDPIVAMLDQLPAHLAIEIAPPDFVRLAGEWLGVELDGALPLDAHRRLVDRASEITRARGTRAGFELLLGLAFPDLHLHVRETGGVTYSTDAERPQPAAEPRVTVVCPPGVPLERRAVIRRVAAELVPAHVTFAIHAEDTVSA